MSTASRNCRNHVQRLRALGFNAPRAPGSRREDPWALRSTRLRWLNNPGGKPQTPCDPGLCKCKPKAKTAAFQGRALSQTTLSYPTHRICRLEARTGTSPPPSFLTLRRPLRGNGPRRTSNARAPPAKWGCQVWGLGSKGSLQFCPNTPRSRPNPNYPLFRRTRANGARHD